MDVNRRSNDYMKSEYTFELYGDDKETELKRKLLITGSDDRVEGSAIHLKSSLMP